MAVAPILFYVPIFGWFARAWGLIPASDKMIRKALAEGHSVSAKTLVNGIVLFCDVHYSIQ